VSLDDHAVKCIESLVDDFRRSIVIGGKDDFICRGNCFNEPVARGMLHAQGDVILASRGGVKEHFNSLSMDTLYQYLNGEMICDVSLLDNHLCAFLSSCVDPPFRLPETVYSALSLARRECAGLLSAYADLNHLAVQMRGYSHDSREMFENKARQYLISGISSSLSVVVTEKLVQGEQQHSPGALFARELSCARVPKTWSGNWKNGAVASCCVRRK